MRARRFILVLAVLGAIALPGACGASTDSDLASDGGSDAGVDAPADHGASDSAADGDAHADVDAACVCPGVPPLTGQPCCPITGSCVYCNASKWELTTAACKAGQWFSVTQWDTPCGTD
jgi:hypothetical protein